METVIRCHMSMGSLHTEQGDLERALQAYEDAHKVARKERMVVQEAAAFEYMAAVSVCIVSVCSCECVQCECAAVSVCSPAGATGLLVCRCPSCRRMPVWRTSTRPSSRTRQHASSLVGKAWTGRMSHAP